MSVMEEPGQRRQMQADSRDEILVSYTVAIAVTNSNSVVEAVHISWNQ